MLYFHIVIESFYALGAIWGGMATPRVCPSSTAYEASRSSGSGLRDRVTAFVNVNVVPMDTERVLPGQIVLVESGRIVAMGSMGKITVPSGAVRIDGHGKYLMPGLADMHYGPSHAIMPPREGGQKLFADQLFMRYVAYGVTGLRSLRESSESSVQQLQRIFAEFPVPRMYLAIEGLPKHRPSNPGSVAAAIMAVKAAGYSQIVGHADTDSVTMAALRRGGLPMVTHSHPMPFAQALKLGASGGSVEHLYAFWDSLIGMPGPYATGGQEDRPVQLPMAKVPPMVAAIKRAGLWITPTLGCMVKIYPNIQDDGLSRVVKALHDAGVKMLLGADGWGDGKGSVHGELEAMVRAGLTPYQALLTGTRHVAEYLDLLDSAGTVAVGRRADLILLNGNPLRDVRHTRELAGVMLAGQWFNRVALDQHQLASPRTWFADLLRRQMPEPFMLKAEKVLPYLSSPPRSMEQWNVLRQYGERILNLADSLNWTSGQEHQHVLRLMVDELETIRTMMTSEEREAFDRNIQPWMRVQAQQGYSVVIPGVQPIP